MALRPFNENLSESMVCEAVTIYNDIDSRVRIIESNYGRNHGWFLEHQGVPLATLTEPRWAEMFWDTYRFEPISDDPKTLRFIYSDQFWDSCEFVFRNRGFPEGIAYGFGDLGPGECEVTVRGVYLVIKEPNLWEMMLYFRRLRRVGSWMSGRIWSYFDFPWRIRRLLR